MGSLFTLKLRSASPCSALLNRFAFSNQPLSHSIREAMLNKVSFDLYGLTPEEIKIVENAAK